MIFQNKTNQKIISSLLVVLILMPAVFFFHPKKASAVCPPSTGEPSAVPVSDRMTQGSSGVTCLTTVKEWAQYLLEMAEMVVAKQVIAQMTQSIVNWINSGFHGSPTFLENPEAFFGDIMKSQIQGFVDVFGYNLQMFPFGRDWAMSAINSYKSTLESNSAFTMNRVMTRAQINDLTNFPTGGWNGFFIKTQYPQNNYIGFQMNVSDKFSRTIASSIQSPATSLNKLLQQGQGFLSPQKCMDGNGNNSYNNGYNNFMPPSWHCSIPECTDTSGDLSCDIQRKKDCDAEKAEWDKTHHCDNLVNTTPGTIVADQIKINLGSSLRQLELATALGDSIAAIVDAFVNKLVSTGLNALADVVSPQPTTDNWSYNGQTLDGGSSGGGGNGELNIPQNVSIQIGGTNPTSTQISGGTPPYSIKTTDPLTPNTAIATANISGSALSITGVAPGQTSVTVKDSSPNVKKVTVNITVVASGDLLVVPASITTETGGSATATVSGGTAPYRLLTGPDETIAMASFSSTALVIIGFAPGQTSVTLADSSERTFVVSITVASNTGGGTTPTGPTVDLTANKTNIVQGESVKLTWIATGGATSCDATWTNSSATSGSETKSPDHTRVYGITCSDDSGASTSDSVTVTVGANN